MSLRYIAIVVASTILVSSHSLAQESTDIEPFSDDPIIIHIDISDGQSITDDVMVTGFLENEETPIAVWWEISDSHGIRSTGTLTSSIDISSGDFERTRWTFQFTVHYEYVIPCSCNMILFAQEESKEPVSLMRSIFFGLESDYLPPTIYPLRDVSDDWHSNAITISGKSLTIDGSTPDIRAIIVNSDDVRCNSDIQQSYTQSSIVEPGSIVWNEDDFSFIVDVSGKDDGWYDITVFSESQESSDFAFYCISTRVDNNPPSPMINGPISSMEGTGSLALDGSETSDDYWGISGITYIWSVKEISASGVIPVDTTTGQSTRQIYLNLSSSGLFNVTLTAVDMAGNSASTSMTVEILNMLPEARFLMDGVEVNDGDQFVVSRDKSIVVDASSSSDTENDIGSLRYIWRIDNVPTYEGEQREFDWPDLDSGGFYLTLEVIDDDYESSILTIRVRDSDGGVSIPSSLVVFIGSIAFLSYALYNRRKEIDHDADIPKWL